MFQLFLVKLIYPFFSILNNYVFPLFPGNIYLFDGQSQMVDSRPVGSRNVSLLFYFVCIFGLSISYSHLWHKSGVVALARLGLEPEPLTRFYTSLYLDYKARVSSVLSHYDVAPPNPNLIELSFLRSWLGDNIFTDFLETVPPHVYIVGVLTSVIITARSMNYPVLSPPSNNFFPEFSSTKSPSFFLNSSVEPHNHVFNLVMMLWERISETFLNIVTYGPIIFSILFIFFSLNSDSLCRKKQLSGKTS